MIRVMKPGDILLLPKDKAPGLYNVIKSLFGEQVADWLANLTKHKYVHAELYVGAGYTLAAWFNGVHLVHYPLSVYDRFDIYTHPKMDDEKREKLCELVRKYFNKPYDFVSLILNGLPEILSLGIESVERYLEEQIDYENSDFLICSELIARMYEDVGLPIEPYPEFVTPDDLAEHLVKVW